MTLGDFGSPACTIKLIMSCVRSSSLSILWNGSRLAPFAPYRGLQQGDPLSPYLFGLCMEKFSLYINLKVEEDAWNPIHISRGGPPISHLFFADDVLLFCKARSSQVRLLMKTVDDFCTASRLSVNFEKSRAQCSKIVSRRRRDNFSAISMVR